MILGGCQIRRTTVLRSRKAAETSCGHARLGDRLNVEDAMVRLSIEAKVRNGDGELILGAVIFNEDLGEAAVNCPRGISTQGPQCSTWFAPTFVPVFPEAPRGSPQ